MKNLYRGVFNNRQSAVILYRQAHSCKQAWLIMCRHIADKDGVNPRTVMELFDGTHDNFEITVETEFREVVNVENC